MQREERMQFFVEEIWKWVSVHRRDLPWRRDREIQDATERAYRVLVSEVMLQQTQVSRVTIAYRNFLEVFPTLRELARASNRDVLLAWRGMGYNSRALRLRDAARTIGQRSAFPREVEELRKIPGIGHYTAAAIRNFAFNLPTPCLDTNIRRILHRTFVGPENPDGTWKKNDRYLLRLAESVLEVALAGTGTPRHTCATWHDALMDYGSLVCTKRNPKWEKCPLTTRGIMKAAYKVPTTCNLQPATSLEPGRFVGSRYIPNRIFRGRVVDELRDEPAGLPLQEIGRRICLDWNPAEHRIWLKSIVLKLARDKLLMRHGKHYLLCE